MDDDELFCTLTQHSFYLNLHAEVEHEKIKFSFSGTFTRKFLVCKKKFQLVHSTLLVSYLISYQKNDCQIFSSLILPLQAQFCVFYHTMRKFLKYNKCIGEAKI